MTPIGSAGRVRQRRPPGTWRNTSVVLQQLGFTGTLGPISGGVLSTVGLTKNAMPIGGLLRLFLVGKAGTGSVPLLLTEPTIMGGVEGLGVGGTITGTGPTFPGGSKIAVTLQAAPWTVHTATATDDTMGTRVTVTRMGFAHGPASGTTSTAASGGVVQLVTPTQITSSVAVPGFKSAMFSELVVRFIPEPDRLVLLGSSVAALALLGGRCVRRKPSRRPT
jgi:hypothetical protein